MKRIGTLRGILLQLAGLLLAAAPVLAVGDGYYTIVETTAWVGTDASRTASPIPAPVGSSYQYDYDYTYGDESSITYILPWTFAFYGTLYDRITIDTNGNVWFGATSSAHSFSLGLNGRGPVVAAWNNDLSSYYYGGVFVQYKTAPEQMVVIEWQTETYTEEGYYRPNNFEVILFPNGTFRIDYKSFSAATITDFGSGISDNSTHQFVLNGTGTVNNLSGHSYFFMDPSYQPPVAGVCGIANGTTPPTAPTTGLCASGTASTVTGSGPWSWTCNGVNGGASAGCFANAEHTVTITTTPGGLVETGTQTVASNETAAVSFITVPGYHPEVTGCNGSLSGNMYITGPVTAECTVAFTFVKSDFLFYEAAYLAANPDVADAVKTGDFTSGWQHYELFGRSGGRALAPQGYGSFNEAVYLLANPDVAAAVQAGIFPNGWEHYNNLGRTEGRPLAPAGYANFDEEAYLAANPGIAAAIQAGVVSSGWEHYNNWGRAEGLPLSPVNYGSFSETAYLLANPDIATAIQEGVISSGWEHYNNWGRSEGRPVHPAGYLIFSEAGYLAANPDVAAAVKAGSLSSGWLHYDIFGKNEGRPITPANYANFSEAAYLAAHPDVAAVVRAGFMGSGWEHYDLYGRNEGRPFNLNSYGSFNEADYLAANPDTFAEVRDGIIASGWEHYSLYGKNEGRKLRP